MRSRRQELSANALSAEINREYALKHDVDILHCQLPPRLYLTHPTRVFCVTLLDQAEVVWLSVGKALNSDENL